MSSIKRAIAAVSTVATLAAIAACGDDVLTPQAATNQSSQLAAPSGASLASANSSTGDTTIAKFTLSGSGSASFNLLGGTHRITFGNGLASVCDPAKAKYGASEWDKPCTPATRPITITAKVWTTANGHPYLDFSPSLRFVPTSDPSQGVVLQLKDQSLWDANANAKIFYCQTQAKCVDEGVTDPSLSTQRGASGFYYRMLKHFSGYVVGTDRDDGTDLSY